MLRWLRKVASKGKMARPARGMDLTSIQREYAGAWVALKGGEVVEARPTPYELVGALHERGIRDTTIIRVPSPEEPELIGLG